MKKKDFLMEKRNACKEIVSGLSARDCFSIAHGIRLIAEHKLREECSSEYHCPHCDKSTHFEFTCPKCGDIDSYHLNQTNLQYCTGCGEKIANEYLKALTFAREKIQCIKR